MSHENAVRQSMQVGGKRLADRVAWLRKMAERQQGTADRALATLQVLVAQAEAAERALDQLREAYRVANGDNTA